jgi:CrcB protein
MKEILMVGAGGFIGASLRFITSAWLAQFTRFGFPLGTFTVNFMGCLLLGIWISLGIENKTTLPIGEFAVVGVLGGFTTFSAFGLETYQFLKGGDLKMGFFYLASSFIVAVAGVTLGIMITK